MERIKRWLWYPHSAEKWFQFEFLYTLDRCLEQRPGRYRVAAEKRAKNKEIPDLGIYDIGEGQRLDQVVAAEDPVAVIELKMIGNWYLARQTLPGIKGDIVKIDRWNEEHVPGIALVFGTVVQPIAKENMYQWIPDCIRAESGVSDREHLLEKIQAKVHKEVYLVREQSYPPDDDFQVMNFCLFGYRNRLARSAIDL